MKFLLKTFFFLALWVPLLFAGHDVIAQCDIKLSITVTKAIYPAENNGSIDIEATNGEAPYAYSINGIGPQVDGNFLGLSPQEYTILVTDSKGCVAETTVVLSLDCSTLPVIKINPFGGPFCITNTSPIQMSANVPSGNFLGPGVSGSSFVPSVAGIGSHTLRYEGKYKGCDISASIVVDVTNNCCPVPQNVKVTPINSTEVTITWDAVPGDILGYEVEYIPTAFPGESDNDFAASSPYNLSLPTDKGNKWKIRIRTICSDDENSDYTEEIAFQTSVTSCNQASPLSVTNITPTSALLNWVAAPNGVSYKIVYYPIDKPDQITETDLSHPNTSISISNLTADTQYEFKVLTTCEENVESGFTFPFKFKTSKDLNKCDPPKVLSATDIRQNSVRLDWTPVEGAFRYEICLRKKGESECRTEKSEVTNFTFTDLTPDTEYEVTVLTICTSVNSEPTPIKNFKTPPAIPPCLPPNNIVVGNITVNFARVTWNKIPQALGYDVRFRRKGESVWKKSFSANPPFNFLSLESDTEYEFQISTRCGDGRKSEFGDTIRFTTAMSPNCNPPKEIKVIETGTTSAKIDWTRVSNASEYEINYRLKGASDFLKITSTVDSVIIPNLDPNRDYEVYVVVFCKNNKISDKTATIPFKTKIPSINCPSPTNIRFENVTGASAKVIWEPSPNAQSYKVFCKEVEGANLADISTPDNFADLSNLKPGVTYQVQIQAICPESNTSVLSPANFVTTTDPNGCLGWTRSFGQNSEDYGVAISLDANGNTYATGGFVGTVTFGSKTLTAKGQMDIYVVKYDFAGNVVWATSAGSNSSDAGFAIASNAAGETYVTGYISGEAQFGDDIVITGAGHTDFFVAKFDPSGNAIWAVRGGGNSLSLVDQNFSDVGLGIAVDNAGSCYVTGKFIGNATIGVNNFPVTSTNPAYEDAFLAKFDNASNLIFFKKPEAQSIDIGTGVRLDKDANIFVSGIFAGQASFGGIVVNSAVDTTTDGFIIKCNPAGDPIEAKTIGGRRNDAANALDIDQDGNVYVTGYFVGQMNVLTPTLTSRGDRDAYVIKYNNNLSPQWAVSGGTTKNDEATAISVDNIGSVYTTGTITGLAEFGAFGAGRVGKTDMYIAQFNANNGSSLNVVSFPTPSDFESLRGIATNEDGNIFVTGDFRDNDIISVNPVTNNGGRDAFVAKFCDLIPPKKACLAPKFFIFDEIKSYSVKVAWDPVIDNLQGSYVIYYRRKGDTKWLKRGAENTPVVLDRLLGGTEYEVALRTVCAPGDTSDFTETQTLTTLQGNGCIKPSFILVDDINNTSALVIWEAVENVGLYKVGYRRVDGLNDFTYVEVAETNSVVITGLDVNSRYEVQVQSICSPERASEFTILRRFSTLLGNCSKPINLRAYPINRNRVTVQWNKTIDAISYILSWRKKGNLSWTSTVITDTSFIIGNLFALTDYEIRVRGNCGGPNNESPNSNIVTVFTDNVCVAPSNFRVTDITHSQVTLEWDAIPAANIYEVDYRQKGDPDFKTVKVKSNSLTLDEFVATTEYEFRIRSSCGSEFNSAYSDVLPVTTPVVCNTPMVIQTETVGVSSMKVRWSRMNDVKGYYLEYKEVDSLKYTRIFVPDQNYDIIVRLKPGTEYNVRVRAVCDIGKDGVNSNYRSMIVKTKSCVQPIINQVTSISQTEATVSWSPVEGAFEYHLQYRETGSQKWIDVLVVDNSEHTLFGLSPNVIYEARVYADCFVENSDPSAQTIFQTKPGCKPPTTITSVPTGTSAQLSWTAMPGATSYIIYYKRTILDGNNWKSITSATNSLLLTKLQTETPYEVRIETHCGGAKSGLSSFHDFVTTGSALCAKPRNFKANSNKNSLLLSWDAMTNVLAYTIQIRKSGSLDPFRTFNLSDLTASSFEIDGLAPGQKYFVILRVKCASGVNETSSLEVSTSVRLGDESTKDELKIYPNPARDIINIDRIGSSTTVLEIFDLLGQRVLTQNLNTTQTEINVSDLSIGTYMLKFTDENGRYTTHKLVINR